MNIDRSKSLNFLLVGALPLLLFSVEPANASPGHHSFSAGEPGDPKQSSRTIKISMREGEGKMQYVPDRVEVRKGEQVRFVVTNEGFLAHEFVLASIKDNLKHAELMKKYPDMEHDDPNSKTVQPHTSVEILWRFGKPGEFEFACLIPGHREAGMLGKVVVK